ncbi:unnamed protein product, partial [Leptidea sinapis]
MATTQNIPRNNNFNIMILLCQCLGISNINSTPNISFSEGVMASICFFTVFHILIGIPLLYMETVISQFTSRDCIDIWKIRPCFSHVGYILILWQIIILINNHTETAFFMHYLFISFETPIPFSTCGPWSDNYCDVISYNYTVNKDCLRSYYPPSYCEKLFATYPEYQYWRKSLVKHNDIFYITWKVCLASATICGLVYLCCFKRERSLRWVVYILVCYPIITSALLLIGSVLQKGVINKYQEAFSLNYKDFFTKFRFSIIIRRTVYNLGIGSGLAQNLSANSSFRTPCLSNIVICVVICTVYNIITISTAAIMTCPYAYELDDSPDAIIKAPLSFIFEKVPRLLNRFDNPSLYLISTFSCFTVLGVCCNVLIFYNLLEVASTRCKTIEKYPAAWILSSIVLCYAFCSEIMYQYRKGKNYVSLYGVYSVIAIIGLLVVIFIMKVIRAALKNKLSKVFQLDPCWGPKSEILQRSRAMFSAQAMTKEYIYRQYHLQAGIIARQRKSN